MRTTRHRAIRRVLAAVIAVMLIAPWLTLASPANAVDTDHLTTFDGGRMAIGDPYVWYRPHPLFSDDPQLLYAIERASGEVVSSWDVSGSDRIKGVAGDLCLLGPPGRLTRAYMVGVAPPLWTYSDATLEAVLAADADAIYGAEVVETDRGTTYLVVAIDRKTGAEHWRRSLGNPPVIPLADSLTGFLHDGMLVVDTGNQTVTALDAATGEVRWAVFNARLVPPGSTGATGLVYVLDADSTLRARDLVTGHVLWSYPGSGVTPEGTTRAVRVEGDLVVVALPLDDLDNGQPVRLVALDGATGVERWRYPSGDGWERPWTFMRAGSSTVLLGVGTTLIAVDPTSGGERWRTSSLRDFVYAGTVDDILVFASRSGWDRIRAIDAGNGETLWETQPAGIPSGWKDVAVTGSHVYAMNQALTAIDMETGEEAWQSGPVVSFTPQPLLGEHFEEILLAIGFAIVLGVTLILIGIVKVARHHRAILPAPSGGTTPVQPAAGPEPRPPATGGGHVSVPT